MFISDDNDMSMNNNNKRRRRVIEEEDVHEDEDDEEVDRTDNKCRTRGQDRARRESKQIVKSYSLREHKPRTVLYKAPVEGLFSILSLVDGWLFFFFYWSAFSFR